MDYYDAYGSVLLEEFLLHAYRRAPVQGLVVTGITVEGQLATPADSFWEAMQACFPEHPMDSHSSRGDWFDRLATAYGMTRFDYQLRWYPSGETVLVAVTRPTAIVLPSHAARQRCADPSDPGQDDGRWFMKGGPGTHRISPN